MTTQLTLLPKASAPWQLDDSTRAIGRQGLATARQALAAARSRALSSDAVLANTTSTISAHAAAA
jgi:hypothetical protein